MGMDNMATQGSAVFPISSRGAQHSLRDTDVQRDRQADAPRDRQEVDNVSRIMRQGHYPHEAEAQREKHVSAIEKQLMVLNGEKHLLEGTLMKFPSNTSGKTLAERRQKRDAEERLEDINKSLSELRQQLKKAQTHV